MNLTIFGANGPTGRLVVRQALAAGHHVTAVTRKPDDFPLSAPELTLAVADVTDAEAVDRAMLRADAVISTYGVPYARREITVYSRGITNVVAAMRGHGITRLVCVTSTTVASGDAPGETLFWRRLVIPVLRHVVGRTLYDDMARMEDVVRRSDLDWTIVRPAGLFDATDPTDDYDVAPHRLKGRFTSRADLAQLLVAEAAAPAHSRSVIEIVTRSGLPSPLDTMRKELFGGA